MKMRQALISIARIAVSPYPRYSESMPLFSHQVFMPTAPITMKMRQALISIARIAVSPYPRYSESMPLFSHQE
jgi:hypothetical protein